MWKKIIIALWVVGASPSVMAYTAGQTVSGYALGLQSDQKILLAGNAINYGSSSIIVARYNTDGTLDTTYGQSGVAFITIANATDQYSYSMAVQTDDKALVVGNAIVNGTSQAVVLRLTTDGVLDTTFAKGGIQTFLLDFPTSFASVVVQEDGKIVIGGSYISDLIEILIARYNIDGSLDTGFGSNGYTLTSVEGNASISTIALQSTQKIVASGTFQGNHIMVRYNTDGSLDSSFGTAGVVITSLNNVAILYGLGINASDELFAGGYFKSQGLVLKYSPQGILDTSFATNGQLLFYSGPLALVFCLYCLTGSVLFAGSSGGLAMVGKITDAGIFDTSFGDSGIMRLTQGVDDSIVYGLDQQNDGQFLAGGLLCRGCLVFRFDGTGILDPSFDGTGFTNEPSGDPCKVTATLM